MQTLLKAIPTREEWADTEDKEALCLSLKTLRLSHDLPKKGARYLLEEKVALMAELILPLVYEFDLVPDHNA